MASKVVLKNTTKLSLNERFTAYRQQAEASALRAAAAAAAAPSVPQPSLRNVRLAQQMATRPTVLAALRLRKGPPPAVLSGLVGSGGGGGYLLPPPGGSPVMMSERAGVPLGAWVLHRSVRQRLGPLSGGVKARLGLRPFHPAGLLLRSRLGLRPLHANGTAQGTPTRTRNRGAARAYYRQPRTNGTLRGQFRPRNRNRNRRRRGGRQLLQQQQAAAAAAASNGQLDPVDRRQLDQQLEAYMARTRSHLDAELDAYMAQASSTGSG